MSFPFIAPLSSGSPSRRLTMFCLCSGLSVFLCASMVSWLAPQAAHAQDSVKVYAKNQTLAIPASSEAILGEAFDVKFRKVDKASSAAPYDNDANVLVSSFVNISDDVLAEAYAPLFAKAGLPMQTTQLAQAGKRYAVAHLLYVTKTKEVSLLSGGAYKGAGKFLVNKLQYGHAVTALLEGDSATLNDKLAAKLLRQESDMSKEAAKRGVAYRIITTAAKAKSGTAPTANSVETFKRRYVLATPVLIGAECIAHDDVAAKPIMFADAHIAPGQWLISSIKVEAESRKSNNSHWDPLLGKPDMIVNVQLGSSVYATSKLYKNTFDVLWQNVNTPMKLDRGQSLQISVTDKDPTGDDYMGAVSIPTDKIFQFEPGQEVYLSTKDENGGVKSATVVFEKIVSRKKK
jgi:hypothetical protein